MTAKGQREREREREQGRGSALEVLRFHFLLDPNQDLELPKG